MHIDIPTNAKELQDQKKSTHGVTRVYVLQQTRKVILFYHYPQTIPSLIQSAAQPAPFHPHSNQPQMTETGNLQVDPNLLLENDIQAEFQCIYISSF